MRHALFSGVFFALGWSIAAAALGANLPDAADAETPALVFKGCGPGDAWYRTILTVISAHGEVVRVEFEDAALKSLAAGRHFSFAKKDDDPAFAARKNGLAFFPCPVSQQCRAADGKLEITSFKNEAHLSGKLTWRSAWEKERITVPFSTAKWLKDIPDCH